ncbi:hypothetical protein [Streptomyces beigongshangae]|uniref:hypothetical protein n=1 Tax=Streptomyces beigongshangae TaxID=2841597 RepID=UPI001C85A367|nr:hypothetical protein [Streptomyces sp. REN17]
MSRIKKVLATTALMLGIAAAAASPAPADNSMPVAPPDNSMPVAPPDAVTP